MLRFDIKKTVKKTAIVATYVIAISLLLSYICELFTPSTYWFIAFFGLTYPFLLLIAICFALLWLFTKHKKYGLYMLLTIALGFNNIRRTYQIGSETIQNNTEPQLRIMSYNVRLFDLYNWQSNEKTRNKIIKFLKNENPDVLCIQEFYYDKTNTFNTLDTLLKALHYKHYHIAYIKEKQNQHFYGIATFSKYPIINKTDIFFENSNNHSIITDIKIKKDTIRFINNHLESLKFNKKHYETIDNITKKLDFDDSGIISIGKLIINSYKKRQVQADSIGKLVNNSKFKTVVCGDFNDPPISYTYNKICTKNNLIDAFVSSGKGLSGTYAGKLPALRIDYIFHTPNIMSSEYGVRKIYLSDHFPIVCKIHL